jgi:tripartite-type tricarboxylate transporter receptor subunit TctC
MRILSAVFHVAIVAVLGLLAGPTAAQNYPSKTIRIIVPFPPGASNDILARIVGKKLTDAFGVQTIVDNRPGASTIIGASALQKSPPDGYTLMVTSGTHLITPMLMPAPYDAIKDFTPVTTIDRSEYLLVVHPALPANNLKEFIALAKSKPGQLNYATSSIGSGNHISAVLLMERTGIKMQHVPYKGGGPAVTDLMAGQVQVFFNSPSSTLPYVQQGKLKAIAVTGEKRMAALPKVPTFTESGLPNFDVKSWHGILAPPGTPKAIVDTIANAVAKILAMPDTVEQLASFGLGPFISTPEQFAAMMKSENERYGKVIKAAGIKGE